MTTTPTSGAAIQRYKIGYHSDEWGHRSSTPSGIPDASGSWVRYADHVTALAAGQATKPAPAPLSEQIDKLERKLAIIAVVGVIDGHDVVRRESVLEIARRAALAAQGGRDAG